MARACFIPLVVLFVTHSAMAEDDLLKSLRVVGKEGVDSSAARVAWDKLIVRGPAVLPELLQAMNTSDTVAANWLRTAFDCIVEVEMAPCSRLPRTPATPVGPADLLWRSSKD